MCSQASMYINADSTYLHNACTVHPRPARSRSAACFTPRARPTSSFTKASSTRCSGGGLREDVEGMCRLNGVMLFIEAAAELKHGDPRQDGGSTMPPPAWQPTDSRCGGNGAASVLGAAPMLAAAGRPEALGRLISGRLRCGIFGCCRTGDGDADGMQKSVSAAWSELLVEPLRGAMHAESSACCLLSVGALMREAGCSGSASAFLFLPSFSPTSRLALVLLRLLARASSRGGIPCRMRNVRVRVPNRTTIQRLRAHHLLLVPASRQHKLGTSFSQRSHCEKMMVS